MKKRIEWLDTLRGMGIIIVVLLHATGNPQIRSIFFNFGVPLFLFVSGYLFHRESATSLPIFLVKRLRTRILPYAIWFLFFYLIVSIQNSSSISSFIQGLVNMTHYDFLVNFFAGHVSWLSRTVHNGPLWFLPFLFWIENIFYFVKKISGLFRIGLFLLLCSTGMFLFSTAVNGVPDLVNMISTHLVTFGAGFMVSMVNENKTITPKNGITLSALWVLSIVVCVAGGLMLGDGPVLSLAGFVFRYIVTFCGIVAFGSLAVYVKGWKWLRFLGANTITVFILNDPLRSLSCDIFAFLNFELFDHLFNNTRELFTLFQVITVLLLSVPCIYLVNNYVPILIGKKKNCASSHGPI